METAPLIFKKEISSLKTAIPMLGTSGLILLAGRPAQGKSALMLSLAKEAAVDKNIPTAIFSLEMNTQMSIQFACTAFRIKQNVPLQAKQNLWKKL